MPDQDQPSNALDSASQDPSAGQPAQQPAEQPPGAEAQSTQEVPQTGSTESQPQSEETVPLKRLQGVQRYFSQQENQWKAEKQQLQAAQEEMRSRLKAIETADMTDAEKRAYEAVEIAREERARREELEQELQTVRQQRELDDYRMLFAAEYGVPVEVTAPYDNFWDMQKAAMAYNIERAKQTAQPQKSRPEPLPAQTQVQTAEGGRAMAGALDPYLSGEKNLKDFHENKRALKKALRG